MKKRLFLMILIMSIASLSACGNSGQEDKGTEPEYSDEAVAEISGQESADEPVLEDVGSGDINLDISSEEDLKAFLVGTWNYKEHVNVELTFKEDGTFEGSQTYEISNATYTFRGTWEFERLYRYDDELPDALVLNVTESDNERYQKLGYFGSYNFDNFAIVDGKYAMGMRRISPDGSVFSIDDNPILYKEGEIDIDASGYELTCSETFEAELWKVEKEGKRTSLLITDLTKNNSKIGLTTKYYMADGYDSKYPISAFDDGFYHVTLMTDEKGDVLEIFQRPDAIDMGVEEYYSKIQAESSINVYIIDKEDYSVANSRGSVILSYFEKPIFGGNDANVKKLNAAIDGLQKMYRNEVNDDALLEELAFTEEFSGIEEFRYSPYSIHSVYYDAEKASVSFDSDWYMGGVYNQFFCGINMDLTTGKMLTIEQVMDMSLDAIKDCIAIKIVEDYGVDYNLISETLSGYDEFTFWFDSNYVYVGFGSYELDMGNWGFYVPLEY